MLYNHKDTIGTGYSAAARMTAREALWPGPPGVDAGVSSTSIESILAGYKRSSTEGMDLFNCLYTSLPITILTRSQEKIRLFKFI